MNKETIQYIKRAYRLLTCIDNEPRTAIIKLLDERRELAVMDIVMLLRDRRWDQSTVSTHLARLRNELLVNLRIEGKYHYYSLNYDRFEQVIDFINKL